jgi:hypothetical protein
MTVRPRPCDFFSQKFYIVHMYVFTCFPRVTDSLSRATVAILFSLIYLRSCPYNTCLTLVHLCTSLYVVLLYAVRSRLSRQVKPFLCIFIYCPHFSDSLSRATGAPLSGLSYLRSALTRSILVPVGLGTPDIFYF